jgi:arylsulfatase A-like enzyme
MMVDNFGDGDLGCYGGGVVRGAPTPRIDHLATQGLRLTNYNVEPGCTPTRSALMIGRMPIRSGTSRVPLPGFPQGITPWEYSLFYAPFSLPHAPPLPNPKFKDKNRTDYQNVLREIDHNAGEVLDAVKAAGVEDDTIVVWCSDNGPETHQGPNIMYGAGSDSGPFRGEFPSGWEGAFRVPCIIRWPGHVPVGRVSNEIVSVLDFYRTFATIAGAAEKVPADRPIDSVDQTDFFLGRQDNSNREYVMFFYGDDLLSVKWRNFKLHFSVRETSRNDIRMPGQQMITSQIVTPTYPWAFDIENDPKELWNISAANTWLGEPVAKIRFAYEQSLADHPSIPPGAEGPKKNEQQGLRRALAPAVLPLGSAAWTLL